MSLSRRAFSAATAGLIAAPGLIAGPARAAGARVVIVGGGFGGASLARYLRRRRPELSVTLIEPDTSYVTCPFSNGVIGGLWPMAGITFSYDAVKAAGVTVAADRAEGIDLSARRVTLAGGTDVDYDFLVLSPGVDFDFARIEGLDEAASRIMPHAWRAGPQTELLRARLAAMPDGGLVCIGVPPAPYRCPPGPYERASLIAGYLKTAKPRSKILILDAGEQFSKQPLFEEAWARLYPGMIERVPASQSGRVVRVDAKTGTVSTEFDDHAPAVANIIPPQTAGHIALVAGLDGDKGFCPVDPLTFESTLQKGVYIIGDAAIANGMPKSGFAANNQAKACGAAILAAIDGREPDAAKLINVCYSFAAKDYAFSVADVYAPAEGTLKPAYEDRRTTPVGSGASVLAAEAGFARGWYQSITREMFG